MISANFFLGQELRADRRGAKRSAIFLLVQILAWNSVRIFLLSAFNG